MELVDPHAIFAYPGCLFVVLGPALLSCINSPSSTFFFLTNYPSFFLSPSEIRLGSPHVCSRVCVFPIIHQNQQQKPSMGFFENVFLPIHGGEKIRDVLLDVTFCLSTFFMALLLTSVNLVVNSLPELREGIIHVPEPFHSLQCPNSHREAICTLSKANGSGLWKYQRLMRATRMCNTASSGK